MEKGDCSSSWQQDSNWTKEEDKDFEKLLIEYPDDCPDRYESIASRLPNKSVDQVRMRYEALVVDVHAIEEGHIPMLVYSDAGQTKNENDSNKAFETVERRPPKKKRDPKCKWTDKEHTYFLLGLDNMGKGDWRGISRNYVQTRSPTQVASHAQKFYQRQSQQRVKKRKSIHDSTLDGSQIQQLSAKPNLNQLHQLGNNAQGQQFIQKVHPSPSESQHIDKSQCMEIQQQDNQAVPDSQLGDHALSLEVQQQQRSQDDEHGQWRGQHQQQSDDLIESAWSDTDPEQRGMLQQQQQIDGFALDFQHDCRIQPQEEHLIHHDHLQTVYDRPKQTSEINGSQCAQKGQMIQQNPNRHDHLRVIEINQGQDAQEGPLIQQTPNMGDQRLALMPLMEVTQGLSAQGSPMMNQNIIRDDQQPIANASSTEASQGQVVREEQRTPQNLNGNDQPRPGIHTEVNQGQGLGESEDLLFDNGIKMSRWNGCYRV